MSKIEVAGCVQATPVRRDAKTFHLGERLYCTGNATTSAAARRSRNTTRPYTFSFLRLISLFMDTTIA